MAWNPVADVQDLPEGEAICVHVGGDRIALYNLDGVVHATQDQCPHGRASLADGYVDGDCIECPLHAGVFHIPSGRAVSGPVQGRIRVYAVKVEDCKILVDDLPEAGAASA